MGIEAAINEFALGVLFKVLGLLIRLMPRLVVWNQNILKKINATGLLKG